LLEAPQIVHTIEKRQDYKISCPEEIALRRGFIDTGQCERLADDLGKSQYAEYIRRVAESLP
jgi:glucose-1-phosphate thymidylyltransferase